MKNCSVSCFIIVYRVFENNDNMYQMYNSPSLSLSLYPVFKLFLFQTHPCGIFHLYQIIQVLYLVFSHIHVGDNQSQERRENDKGETTDFTDFESRRSHVLHPMCHKLFEYYYGL